MSTPPFTCSCSRQLLRPPPQHKGPCPRMQGRTPQPASTSGAGRRRALPPHCGEGADWPHPQGPSGHAPLHFRTRHRAGASPRPRLCRRPGAPQTGPAWSPQGRPGRRLHQPGGPRQTSPPARGMRRVTVLPSPLTATGVRAVVPPAPRPPVCTTPTWRTERVTPAAQGSRVGGTQWRSLPGVPAAVTRDTQRGEGGGPEQGGCVFRGHGR